MILFDPVGCKGCTDTTDAAGEKVNFVTTIHKDMMKPVNQKMLHKRKVTQLTEKEKSGPLFSGDYPEGRP